jgi:flavin-binding protein dodecin
MSDNVYKKIEIVGTSATSLEDAIQNAVGKAAQTVGPVAGDG